MTAAATWVAKPPRGRAWRIVRRALQVVAGTLAAAVLLVVTVVAVVLWTPWGTRTAIGFALARYDAGVAGSVSVATIDGTLGGTLELGLVALTDGGGNPLIVAEQLRLALQLPALLTRTVAFDELSIAGLVVHIGGDQARFADLGPDTPPEPKPAGMVGPELPIGFDGPLTIDGLEILQHLPDGTQVPLVQRAVLRATLHSRGREATARVEAFSALVGARPDVTIASLTGTVTWRDPEVRIEGLTMLSDRGIVQQADLGFDADLQRGDAIVRAVIDVANLAPDTQLPIHGLATVDVEGAGDAAHAWARVRVAAEPDARVDLIFAGSIASELELAGMGTVQVVPPGTREPLVGFVVAHAARASDRPLLGSLLLQCIGCAAPVGAVVDSHTSASGTTTTIDARLFVADATARASATIHERALTRAEADLELPSVQRVRQALTPWVGIPELEGRATASASCRGRTALLECTAVADARRLAYGEIRLEHLELEAAVAIREGKPTGHVTVSGEALRWGQHEISRLRIAAAGGREHLDVDLTASAPRGRTHLAVGIDPGRRTRIALRDVALDLETLHVRLMRPSQVVIAADVVAIDDLRLAVNRGVIRMDGVMGPRSDARLAIEGFDLAALAPLRLPVRLGGVVHARAELHGRPEDPTVSLILDADRLRVDEHSLGAVGSEVELAQGGIDARLRWKPGPNESIDLRARAQLRAFDDPRGPGLSAGAPLRVEIDAQRLALARLEPWLGEHTIDGDLDATVRITGSASRPAVTASIEGRGLLFDSTRIDDLELRASHDAGRVDLNVVAHAAWLDGIDLTASVPVRIAGVAPYYALDRRGSATVTLALDRLELAGLRGLVPALDVDGGVYGTLRAEVDRGALETARAELLAHDLTRDGERIATLSVDAELGDERLRGSVQASGPAIRLVEAQLDLPMRVDVGALELEWLRRQPHALDLTIVDADLGAIGRIANLGGMAGRINGSAKLEGPAAAPRINVALRGHQLGWAGRAVGEFAVDVDHRDGHTLAVLRQSRGIQSVRLDADVPLTFDLSDRGVRWDRSREHRVELDAIAVDEELLAAFVTVPDKLVFELNAEVQARGSADALAARGRLRANLDNGDGLATPIAGHFELTSDRQRVDVVLGPFEDSALELTATAHAPLLELLAGKAVDWRAVAVVAAVDTDHFPLSGLAPFLPDALDEPAGRLDLHFAATGTVGSPNLRGRALVAGGAITLIPLRQRFDRIAIDVALERQDIRLTKLSLRSGSGRAHGTGRLHLARGDTAGKLELALTGLPIVRPGMPLMKLSTRATATLDATGKRTLIDVVARRTTLDVFTASATAPTPLPTTEGVVFVDAPVRLAKRVKTPSAREPVLPPDMSVRVALADPVFVRGPQANMTWRGEVAIERTVGEKVRAHGALVADRGRINFLGRDFIVDSGRITLPEQGDLDPYIALTAVTQTEEGEVSIDVHGRASRPELRLSSDPPMSESEVFALLVTGSSGATQDEGERGDVQAKAASLLAAFQNPVLQRELQDRIGVDRVGVSFGDSVEEPILAVGKRVSRKVYVETRYHHNAPQFENTAEIRLEYSIKPPAWTVETFIGDAAKGGLEVWWRKRFGRPRAPKSTARRDPQRLEKP